MGVQEKKGCFVFSVSQCEYNLSSPPCDFEGLTLDSVIVRSHFVAVSVLQGQICAFTSSHCRDVENCMFTNS